MPLRGRIARAPVEPASLSAKSPVAQESTLLRHARSAFVYVPLGFVAGAMFWHLVGFWDVVGKALFNTKQGDASITQAARPIKLKERVSGISPLAVVLEPEACTSLQLDRATGVTTAAACEVEALPLRSLKTAKREDLWVTAEQRVQEATSRGWAAVTVEAPGKPVIEASSD
jgi:hypothetical protein